MHRALSYGGAKEFGGVAPDIICAYKMASYTLRLLKKFAARPRGEGFFIAKGGGEKFSLAKSNEIVRAHHGSARPDLRITSVDIRISGSEP